MTDGERSSIDERLEALMQLQAFVEELQHGDPA
jgi:hypothetical protein